MIVKAMVIQGRYLDSVKLMLISRSLSSLPGVQDAVAILATQENRGILKATDMLADEVLHAAETDIVVVVKALDEDSALSAIREAAMTISDPSPTNGSRVRLALGMDEALKQGSDLCLISIAGRYAAREARKALQAGLHVMIFSDNVSLEDELSLKRLALSKGVLMMGPDCGTAIINGVPLAFANAVPKGGIGIVSASGTGLQEISAGIANRGMGITQAFGTGGRDGKEAIGGLMLKACLRYLIADPATEVIVLIAKTPHPGVRNELWELIGGTAKPVIANFLDHIEHPHLDNLHYAVSLQTCAHLACFHYARLHGLKYQETHEALPLHPTIQSDKRRWLRGLYSGGTLCAEAHLIYKHELGGEPYSNISSREDRLLKDPWRSIEDSLIDLGSDEYTVGRPHPMIDLSLRIKRLAAEASDPEVAVILLDVVLGYGAHPDPASELAPVIAGIDRDILIVCNVLGTAGDPQDRASQMSSLREAGAVVFSSHHAAADYAIQAIKAIRGIS